MNFFFYKASVTIYIFFPMCLTESQGLASEQATLAGKTPQQEENSSRSGLIWGWGGGPPAVSRSGAGDDRRTYQTCKCSHCFHPLTKCHNLKHQNFNFNYKLFHVLTCCIIVLFPFKESTPCQRLSDKLSAEYFLCSMF